MMAEPQNHDFRDRPHVVINAFRKKAVYRVPGQKMERKPLRGDYAAHAASILSQLNDALGDVPTSGDDTRLRLDGLKPGAVIEIATLAPTSARATAARVPTAMDFVPQDIVVLRTERNDDRSESALVFVPDSSRGFLKARVADYGGDIGNRKRPDIERFEVIETVEAADARKLFVGEVDFASPSPRWWELWIREAAGRADLVVAEARRAGLDVHQDRLTFPDTIVVFLHGSATAVGAFVARVPGAVTEVRHAIGTVEPFLERGDAGGVYQADWVDELLARVTLPAAGASVVCTLDTGIAAAHPLLVGGIHGAWAYDAAWGTDDHVGRGGHGTALASTVLYGDLMPLMADLREITLTHAIESMKLLPPDSAGRTATASYGTVTQGAVSLVEIERPGILRSFCMASSTADNSPERPSSWSGALDQIAAGSMPGDASDGVFASMAPKRFLITPTGNVQGGMRADVLPLQALEDPAQSWNALSVGGFTTKELSPQEDDTLVAVVGANNRSPYSRGSHSLPSDLTPLKPEVMFEAGNMVADKSGYCAWHESVSLLAAGSDHVAEPLVPFWATSAAAGMAGNFIGRLQAALPDLWPETHRALTVDSAQWPQPIRKHLVGTGAHWKKAKVKPGAARQRLLREFGYGVPDIERALKSARNDVTLVAEAEIQPFESSDDGRSAVFKDMHFYDLPWPRASLEQLENELVTMKVTLSYYIEPNLTGKAATRPDTYRSFGLRFKLKKRSESMKKFRSRVSAAQEKDVAETADEESCWLLGPKAISAGSLHCDLWRGQAVDLAGHDAIAIVPVTGWWKTHVGQRRMDDRGRYSLVISISASGHAVDLHSEVSALVGTGQVVTSV